MEIDEVVIRHEMLRRAIEICTDSVLKKNEAVGIKKLCELAVTKLTEEIDKL